MLVFEPVIVAVLPKSCVVTFFTQTYNFSLSTDKVCVLKFSTVSCSPIQWWHDLRNRYPIKLFSTCHSHSDAPWSCMKKLLLCTCDQSKLTNLFYSILLVCRLCVTPSKLSKYRKLWCDQYPKLLALNRYLCFQLFSRTNKFTFSQGYIRNAWGAMVKNLKYKNSKSLFV